MAALPNQMVTFQDLQDLIDLEGFTLNNAFTPSTLCADKLEVIDALNIVVNNLDNLEDNQLVQRSLIEKVADPVDNPPTSATVVLDSISYNTANISWSGATDDNGIDFYDLYILYPGDVLPTFIVRLPNNIDLYQFDNLIENSSYTFYVVPIDTIGQDDGFNGFVLGTTLVDLNPTAPTLFLVSKNTDTIVLGWSGATDDNGISGYRIYENNVLIDTTPIETYTHDNLNPDTPYSYHIVTVDNIGQISPNSNTLNVTTDAVPSVDPPTAPTSITVIDTGPGTLQVTWSGATAGAGIKGYNLYNGFMQFKIYTTLTTIWIPNLQHGSYQTIYVETIDNNDVVSETKANTSPEAYTEFYPINAIPQGQIQSANRRVSAPDYQLSINITNPYESVWEDGHNGQYSSVYSPTRSKYHWCDYDPEPYGDPVRWTLQMTLEDDPV